MSIELASRTKGWGAAVRLASGNGPRADGGLILAYHDIGEPGPEFNRHSVSPAHFRRQLASCRAWGLRFIGLRPLLEMLLAGRDTTGFAAIAFDDCFSGVHRHAFPILTEMDVPATLFVVSGAIGTRPNWVPGAARTMTRQELQEMVAAGFALGSHGRTHRSLIELDYSSVFAEVSESRRRLEDLFGEDVGVFAYPYGHHDPRVRRAVVNVGYRAACSFLNGRLTRGIDRYRVPRLNMHQGLTGLRLARLVARPPARWPDTQLDVVTHHLAW